MPSSSWSYKKHAQDTHADIFSSVLKANEEDVSQWAGACLQGFNKDGAEQRLTRPTSAAKFRSDLSAIARS